MNTLIAPEMGEIPHYLSYTSPVSTARIGGGSRATTLPLNLVALIVSYLDDISDIARVTRTSRLLYYMTLPQLYQRVSLHSYNKLRYVNGRLEGFGSGSPFMMALNGLVTKGHAALVQEFRLWGQWNEVGVEDFAKGRVPDNSMMLNILTRAATDKMTKLEYFSWELDGKPLKTLYQGLAAHGTLTRLTLRFPSNRVPRPCVMVPPIPNLRVLKVMNIDPLCYPDDISLLLLHSRKLVDLRLHFSPRMRREAESSVSLTTYFNRCENAGYQPKIKHFAMQNFFGANMEGGSNGGFDSETCQSVTFLDTWGGMGTNPETVFVDDTWKNIPTDLGLNFRMTRCNEVATQHVEILRRSCGMERLYLINNQSHATESMDMSPTSANPITPGRSPPPDEEMARLGKEYLHVLTRNHGQTLKHLLLRREWALNAEDIGEIVRYCPNLEQLGFALNISNINTLRILLPFLHKLKALRILDNAWCAESLRTVSEEERIAGLSAQLSQTGTEQIQYIGMADHVYKIGGNYQVVMDDGTAGWRREVTMAPKDEAQHLEIWDLDRIDIDADPIASFAP